MKNNTIHMYTDGACRGNPGPAGAGVLLKYNKHSKEISEYIGHATNNVAELTAIKIGLETLKDNTKPIIIYSDSAYCIGLFTKDWNPKKNLELISEIKELLKRFNDVTFKKVKGHGNNFGNNKADQLAVSASNQGR